MSFYIPLGNPLPALRKEISKDLKQGKYTDEQVISIYESIQQQKQNYNRNKRLTLRMPIIIFSILFIWMVASLVIQNKLEEISSVIAFLLPMFLIILGVSKIGANGGNRIENQFKKAIHNSYPNLYANWYR